MPGGPQNSGSVMTSPPVQCPTCGDTLRKQHASTVWCSDQQMYANQQGVHHDKP